jgi:tripartite-type tricarboxylate transporter receptor subunit TctC
MMAKDLRGAPMFVRNLLLAVFTLLILSPVTASTDRWPSRPVKILVPYAAGGNSDGMARIAAQHLAEAFGQPFIVENRVGANGSVAGEAVVRSSADGYTLLWAATPSIAIAPALYKLPYHPINDLVPISVVGINGFVLLANKDVPAKTLAEFVAYVRARPKILSYAEGSAGGITHLGMALFLRRAGLEMQNVSYRGNAPALSDVIAGHLPAMFSNISDAVPHAESGAIRLLAVSTDSRVPQLPKVPTFAESGFPGFNVMTWNGLMAPSGTPRDIVDRVGQEIRKAAGDPIFVSRLDGYGAAPLGNTPEDFRTMIAADTKLWAEAVKFSGIKLQ